MNVTLCKAVPPLGIVEGAVKANVPEGVDEPPVRVEEASVWPKVIALAVGQAVMLGANR